STADLIGNRSVIDRMAKEASAGTMAHAVLIIGPESSGKTSAALALAEVALHAAAWPGGVSAHPDLWVEDSPAENISIQRIRAGGELGPTLQDFMALRTYAGGHRVAVIARCERLTETAADCLLKTIEE